MMDHCVPAASTTERDHSPSLSSMSPYCTYNGQDCLKFATTTNPSSCPQKLSVCGEGCCQSDDCSVCSPAAADSRHVVLSAAEGENILRGVPFRQTVASNSTHVHPGCDMPCAVSFLDSDGRQVMSAETPWQIIIQGDDSFSDGSAYDDSFNSDDDGLKQESFRNSCYGGSGRLSFRKRFHFRADAVHSKDTNTDEEESRNIASPTAMLPFPENLSLADHSGSSAWSVEGIMRNINILKHGDCLQTAYNDRVSSLFVRKDDNCFTIALADRPDESTEDCSADKNETRHSFSSVCSCSSINSIHETNLSSDSENGDRNTDDEYEREPTTSDISHDEVSNMEYENETEHCLATISTDTELEECKASPDHTFHSGADTQPDSRSSSAHDARVFQPADGSGKVSEEDKDWVGTLLTCQTSSVFLTRVFSFLPAMDLLACGRVCDYWQSHVNTELMKRSQMTWYTTHGAEESVRARDLMWNDVIRFLRGLWFKASHLLLFMTRDAWTGRTIGTPGASHFPLFGDVIKELSHHLPSDCVISGGVVQDGFIGCSRDLVSTLTFSGWEMAVTLLVLGEHADFNFFPAGISNGKLRETEPPAVNQPTPQGAFARVGPRSKERLRDSSSSSRKKAGNEGLAVCLGTTPVGLKGYLEEKEPYPTFFLGWRPALQGFCFRNRAFDTNNLQSLQCLRLRGPRLQQTLVSTSTVSRPEHLPHLQQLYQAVARQLREEGCRGVVALQLVAFSTVSLESHRLFHGLLRDCTGAFRESFPALPLVATLMHASDSQRHLAQSLLLKAQQSLYQRHAAQTRGKERGSGSDVMSSADVTCNSSSSSSADSQEDGNSMTMCEDDRLFEEMLNQLAQDFHTSNMIFSPNLDPHWEIYSDLQDDFGDDEDLEQQFYFHEVLEQCQMNERFLNSSTLDDESSVEKTAQGSGGTLEQWGAPADVAPMSPQSPPGPARVMQDRVFHEDEMGGIRQRSFDASVVSSSKNQHRATGTRFERPELIATGTGDTEDGRREYAWDEADPRCGVSFNRNESDPNLSDVAAGAPACDCATAKEGSRASGRLCEQTREDGVSCGSRTYADTGGFLAQKTDADSASFVIGTGNADSTGSYSPPADKRQESLHDDLNMSETHDRSTSDPSFSSAGYNEDRNVSDDDWDLDDMLDVGYSDYDDCCFDILTLLVYTSAN